MSLVPWQAIRRTIPLSKHWSARSTGTASSRTSNPTRCRPGLDEDVIRLISRKKDEPQFMLRLAAEGVSPLADDARAALGAPAHRADRLPGDLVLLGAQGASADAPKSLEEVDPKLLETYDKLGIPLHERARLAGVAVDAVFDSVSVATTFKERLGEGRRDLLFVLRSGAEASGSWSRSISAASCRTRTTTSRR